MIPKRNRAPFDTIDQKYRRCKREAFGDQESLGNKQLPTFIAASVIMLAHEKTAVDPALIAATWAGESNFSLAPESGTGQQIGPMQIGFGVWGETEYIVGDAFGTNLQDGESFNGNFQDNVISAANILGFFVGKYGLDSAAGYYRTGEGPWRNTEKGNAALAEREALWSSVKEA